MRIIKNELPRSKLRTNITKTSSTFGRAECKERSDATFGKAECKERSDATFGKAEYKKRSDTTSKHPKKYRKSQLIKRIIITNLMTLGIIVATYFWMMFFISNVGSFWDLFRNKEIFVYQDTVPPSTPFLEPIPEAIKNDTFDVSGRAEEGVKIILYIDGTKTSETTSDSEGIFSFTNLTVGLFKQSIYVTAQDEAKNESNKSTVYDIVKDNEPPEVEVINPKNEEEFKSTGHTYTVIGKTEPGSAVLVNDQLAIINPEGEFTASIRLNEGDNAVTVVVKDKAQNETEKKVFVRFIKIN